MVVKVMLFTYCYLIIGNTFNCTGNSCNQVDYCMMYCLIVLVVLIALGEQGGKQVSSHNSLCSFYLLMVILLLIFH